MGLFKKLLGKKNSREDQEHTQKEILRRCHFEIMEERRVLTANPVVAGVTYLEGDSGLDTAPDYFEVTFEGGAETTELTQFTINGDQDLSGGQTIGDVFFHANAGQVGAGTAHPFEFQADSSIGISESDILGVNVSEDGLTLTVDVQNFEAGDVLAFTIDVDEVESLRPDFIASGVEFEGSFFGTTFVDENYTFNPTDLTATTTIDGGFVQDQSEGIFFDNYDQLLAEGEAFSGGILDLVRDNEDAQANRSAGAVDAFELEARPITISGTVFHDENLSWVQEDNESGIAGVTIDLQRLNDAGVYETVATTQTDANGDYSFGEELGLTPGEYQLVQTQPDGYLEVGANAGTVEGEEVGTVEDVNIISNINIPVGGTDGIDYDFKEIRPASIEGNVFHDANDDGVFDPNEEGIANVLIQVTRVGAKPGVEMDPFADTTPIFVRTDANGHYSVDVLPPGVYEVVEINDERSADALAPFLDGQDSVGNVRGTTVGTASNDRFSEIHLCADDHGVEYNFGEITPASIGGNVGANTPDGKVGIEDVTIQLFDADGNLVAETQTDENGDYEFSGLAPGNYSIVEVQPEGFLDAEESIGSVRGVQTGSVTNDRFTNIVLNAGDQGVNYDFCEHVPASLWGTVWHDANNDGVIGANEDRIANVEIRLTDANGDFVASTTTNSDGEYHFEDLAPGHYTITEIQPTDFVDGRDSLGTVTDLNGNTRAGGEQANDEFTVWLDSGDQGTNYDFGELLPASISGFVHTDPNGDGELNSDFGDQVLANVAIELLDNDGNVVATTTTDENGFYEFTGLQPGNYTLVQSQPDGVFTAGQNARGNGNDTVDNVISEIVIASGDRLTDYNFCEHLPAEIHGRVFQDGPAFETEDGNVPDGFRSQRDGIFQSSTDTPLEGVRVELYYFIDPTSDSIAPRAVTLGEVQSEFYSHLGDDPNAVVFVETDANGEYWFQGLQSGNYIVVEVQPDGFVDSNDTPGTTTGFTFNDTGTQPQSELVSTFTDTEIQDSIVNIFVAPGGVSLANNFSEVLAVQTVQPDDPFDPNTTPTPPTPIGNPVTPRPGPGGLPGLFGAQAGNFTQVIGSSPGSAFQISTQPPGEAFAWHLSVINGGSPRAVGEADLEGSPWLQASAALDTDWSSFEMDQATWTYSDTVTAEGEVLKSERLSHTFGMIGGIPLAGDFDGDGIDEIAIYHDGYWMIDINKNGRWDAEDLIAHLGDGEDQPVVGDWDGDGKEDIGIYGPAWDRDAEAIAKEPGLPNPDNQIAGKYKNIPPTTHDSTTGARYMKLSAYGQQRADVIDHVFGLDDHERTAVTGDWNGNGIRSIGTFENGQWKLDVNGDGEFDYADTYATFGKSGDIPLVGDWDGDGIEQIAVYRSGTWIVDSNQNYQIDATDLTFQHGGDLDQPVVGDWDGDGRDEPALFSSGQNWNKIQ